MALKDSAIATRYAMALGALGDDGANLNAIASDLGKINDAFASEDGALLSVMANPGFLISERRAILDAVIAKVQPEQLVANFLRLLLDKRRFGSLTSIISAFNTLLDEKKGRLRAEVVTAFDLSDALNREIHSTLTAATGREVVLSSRVDSGLIGGLVIKVGDTVYDASIRSRLQSLQRQLLSGATPAEA